jgi:hypothetical protein
VSRIVSRVVFTKSTTATDNNHNVSASCLIYRIGLQCSTLRFPEEVTRPLQLEVSFDRSFREDETDKLAAGSRGTIEHLECRFPAEEGKTGGLLVKAGLPWWRCRVP